MSQTLFTSGDRFFQQYLEAIGSARSEVSGISYIFRNDQLGRDVLDALLAAQLRGVRVRWVVDGLGSYDEETWLRDHLGTSLKIYHPVRLGSPKLSILNQRCHMKLLVVDHSIVFFRKPQY